MQSTFFIKIVKRMKNCLNMFELFWIFDYNIRKFKNSKIKL